MTSSSLDHNNIQQRCHTFWFQFLTNSYTEARHLRWHYLTKTQAGFAWHSFGKVSTILSKHFQTKSFGKSFSYTLQDIHCNQALSFHHLSSHPCPSCMPGPHGASSSWGPQRRWIAEWCVNITNFPGTKKEKTGKTFGSTSHRFQKEISHSEDLEYSWPFETSTDCVFKMWLSMPVLQALQWFVPPFWVLGNTSEKHGFHDQAGKRQLCHDLRSFFIEWI